MFSVLQCYTHRFLGWKIHVNDYAVTLLPTTLPPDSTEQMVGETRKPVVTKVTGAVSVLAASVTVLITALCAALFF